MKRLVPMLLGAALVFACDGTYRILMPYCPVSDSAWAAADSVPVVCITDSAWGRP